MYCIYKIAGGYITMSKNGFTLAEVLITLGIIGVVAAMTMPSLVTHYKEKQTVTALKKFYSILEQAIRLNQIDNPEDYSGENIVSMFKTVKLCQPGDKSCAVMQYKQLNGAMENAFGKSDSFFDSTYYAQLIDGSIIRYASGNSCNNVRGTTEALKNVCGEFSIDINGNKLPNQMGRDVFFFNITKYGVVPFGTKEEKRYSFSENCKDKSSGDGKSCAAWVLINENMDYLHCNDLDWSRKTKCK